MPKTNNEVLLTWMVVTAELNRGPTRVRLTVYMCDESRAESPGGPLLGRPPPERGLHII